MAIIFISTIFQNFNLIPTLTALENVALSAELNGTNGSKKKSIELLSLVGLANRFIIVDIPCPTNCAWLMPQDIWRNATAEPFFNLDSGLRHLVGYVAHDLTNEALGTTTATHMAGLVIDALTSRLRRSWKSAAICRALEDRKSGV